MLPLDKISSLPIPVLNSWGYWIILFTAIFEAFPLFGTFIPGQLTIVLGGFLAKRGVLDIGDVIVVASLGAIIGDFIGYILGKYYGDSFLTKYGKYFFFKKEYFEKTKKLINNHIGKTLIIGRFNPLTRAFAPFVAGSTEVSFFKFLAYNIIGGISWATVFVMIGYIFGASYEVATGYVGKFIFIAIILSAIILYLYHITKKTKISKGYFYILIINLSSLYLLSKIIEDVVDGELVYNFDVWINAKITLLQDPILNKIMIFITNIVSPIPLLILSVILLSFLIYKKKKRYSLLLLFGMAGGLIFESAMKLIIHRARPENALLFPAGYSFPSGHATIAIIFFPLLVYFAKPYIKNKILQYGFIFIGFGLPLLIGFSRIYLKVHWFSDVIGGFALGIFWLTSLVLLFKFVESSPKKAIKVIEKL